ncbi:hypothetical protein K7X08_012722 [Anisodus acutangulus]|uniref:Uncharacterized protein n=1 Tax=Anisodus acutangulus TaxID=402998 RepID=A0A9Q1MAJ7_9SOLA|nr:hypothetical protein K7X08_012722 [Anisodus acutangulus]
MVRPFLYPTIGEMEKDHIRNLIPYNDEVVDEGIDALRKEIVDATWINRLVEPRQRKNKEQVDEKIDALREEIDDATLINRKKLVVAVILDGLMMIPHSLISTSLLEAEASRDWFKDQMNEAQTGRDQVKKELKAAET